jgi:hypothetical protein
LLRESVLEAMVGGLHRDKPTQESDHQQAAQQAKEAQYALECTALRLAKELAYVKSNAKLHRALDHIRTVSRSTGGKASVLAVENGELDGLLQPLSKTGLLRRHTTPVFVGLQQVVVVGVQRFSSSPKRGETIISSSVIADSGFPMKASWELLLGELADGADPAPTRSGEPGPRYKLSVAVYAYVENDQVSMDDEEKELVACSPVWSPEPLLLPPNKECLELIADEQAAHQQAEMCAAAADSALMPPPPSRARAPQ